MGAILRHSRVYLKNPKQAVRCSCITILGLFQFGALSVFSATMWSVIEKSLCQRVLSGECLTAEERNMEVRPELLPSAMLDYKVSLMKLKKYFPKDVWMLFISSGVQSHYFFQSENYALLKFYLFHSVATKKTTKLWMCGLCKKPDDGEVKMVCCDQCLEWFHW